MVPALWLLTLPLGAAVASNSLGPTVYSTVQAAIDGGTNLYTVWVFGAETNNGLTISNKSSMNLRVDPAAAGAVRFTSAVPGAGQGLRIQAGVNILVEGLCFSNYSGGLTIETSTTNIRISKNAFLQNSNSGIVLKGPRVTLTSNTVLGPAFSSAGLILSNGTHSNLVLSNRFAGHTAGIEFAMGSFTSNNQVLGNLLESNQSRGVNLFGSSWNNLLAYNTVIGASQIGIYAAGGSYGNDLVSNTFIGGTYAILCDSITTHKILWNDCQGQSSYGIAVWNTPGQGFQVSSNTVRSSAVGVLAGIIIGTSSKSNRVIGNTVAQQPVGIQIGGGSGSASNFLSGNDVYATTQCAVQIDGTSHSLVLVDNRIHDNLGAGVRVDGGPTNLQITRNLILGNAGIGLSFSSNSTNHLVASNILSNNGGGFASGPGNAGHRIIQNLFFANGSNQFNNTVATPALYAPSNYFGPGNRPFSAKGIAGSGQTAADPWLNGPIGGSGDWVAPSAPTTLVASNGLAGQVNLHWARVLPIDFSRTRIFRTQVSNAYSNLTDGDQVGTILVGATTNWVDTPSAGGTYHYYVTISDTNSNESWYSPQASVAYLSNMPPTAAFSGPAYWSTNLAASFTNASIPGTGILTNFLWDFGDGATLLGSNTAATHLYAVPMNGFVSLTVWNDLGQSNTVSNALGVYALSPVSGKILGTVTNGVSLTLSGATGNFATNSTAAGFVFLVSNGSYALAVSKLGYRFSPASRSVTVLNSPVLGQDFTASDIYPALSFSNLTNRQYVVRDLVMNVSADAPEILSSITYRFWNEPGTPAFSTNLSAAYGKEAVLDTTLLQDGFYNLRAEAADIVFGRTHSNQILCFLDNQVFKILGKGLEDRHAIVYDNVIPLGGDSPVELFFHLKENQKVQIGVYDKWGKAVGRFPDRLYPHGPNRLVWDRVPKDLPAGVYYAFVKCAEYSVSVPIVFTRR
ncbi:MAG: right-handed parallel beta-helix repeat-containing protein [Spirochaetes bacterium]|nr:right-handed parallel beta-helix repeat-containing protein [Spirochaetota bacterium]